MVIINIISMNEKDDDNFSTNNTDNINIGDISSNYSHITSKKKSKKSKNEQIVQTNDDTDKPTKKKKSKTQSNDSNIENNDIDKLSNEPIIQDNNTTKSAKKKKSKTQSNDSNIENNDIDKLSNEPIIQDNNTSVDYVDKPITQGNTDLRKTKNNKFINKQATKANFLQNTYDNLLHKLDIMEELMSIVFNIKDKIPKKLTSTKLSKTPKPTTKDKNKQVKVDNQNAPTFKKFLNFIEKNYPNSKVEFLDIKPSTSVQQHINTNTSNLVSRLAKDILEYRKFQNVNLNNLTQEEIEIFTIPIANMVTITINLIFFFVLRDLSNYIPQEIMDPLFEAVENGKLSAFLGRSYNNMMDISQDHQVNKKIECHLKTIFNNTIPEEIKQNIGAYDYYYALFKFIAFSSYVPDTFAADIAQLVNKRNMIHTSESSTKYEITWVNTQNKKDTIQEKSLEYPQEQIQTINGQKYKIKDIITDKTPNVSYYAESILVQNNGSLDITNLDKFFNNPSNTCYDITNELTLAGWSVIQTKRLNIKKSYYSQLSKTRYSVHSKGNGIYEIRTNPQINFGMVPVYNPEDQKTRDIIIDAVPTISSYVNKII